METHTPHSNHVKGQKRSPTGNRKKKRRTSYTPSCYSAPEPTRKMRKHSWRELTSRISNTKGRKEHDRIAVSFHYHDDDNDVDDYYTATTYHWWVSTPMPLLPALPRRRRLLDYHRHTTTTTTTPLPLPAAAAAATTTTTTPTNYFD